MMVEIQMWMLDNCAVIWVCDVTISCVYFQGEETPNKVTVKGFESVDSSDTEIKAP